MAVDGRPDGTPHVVVADVDEGPWINDTARPNPLGPLTPRLRRSCLGACNLRITGPSVKNVDMLRHVLAICE